MKRERSNIDVLLVGPGSVSCQNKPEIRAGVGGLGGRGWLGISAATPPDLLESFALSPKFLAAVTTDMAFASINWESHEVMELNEALRGPIVIPRWKVPIHCL